MTETDTLLLAITNPELAEALAETHAFIASIGAGS